ncbi:MAG TPA: PIN domain-containing protein [Paracoccus sp. (in: a-proteobacteria)]|nr:PIN domain-containing protein [Paracoccus sp. (in: a-proteobacteria)]
MKAVLDACVLYPTVLREILIGAAEAGLFQPVWSARILAEWRHAAARLGGDQETVAGAEIALLRARHRQAEVADGSGLARPGRPPCGRGRAGGRGAADRDRQSARFSPPRDRRAGDRGRPSRRLPDPPACGPS